MRIFSFSTVLLLVTLLVVLYDSTSADRQLLKGERQEEKSISRERRSLAKILVVGSLSLSVTAIAYDAFLSHDGCCKMFNACDKLEELDTLKQRWMDRALKINEIALDASKMITFVDSIHSKNQIIQTKIIKIIKKVDELVKTLSGDDLNSLKELQQKVEQIKNDNEQTIDTWSLHDIDLAFKGLWSTKTGRLMLFAPLFLELGGHALGRLYQDYKVRQISKELGDDLTNSILKNSRTKSGGIKAFKMMGRPTTSSKSFLTETAMARYKASRGATGRFMSFAHTSFSLFSIGLDIWHGYEKTVECKKSVDQIKKMHAYMTGEIAKLDGQETLVQKAKVDTNTAYTTLTDSISSIEFLEGVQSIINLVSGASTQNTVTKETVRDMELFKSTIKIRVEYKDSAKIIELQDTLSSALNNVQYTYECYVNKAASLSRMVDGCKKGNDVLTSLYAREKNSLRSCVIDDKAGTPIYLSYEAVETYVAADAEKNDYISPACKLNHQNTKTLICMDYCDDDVEDVAENHDVTADQVKVLCKTHICSLSRKEKKRICKFKKYSSLEETVSDYGEPYRAAITVLYNDENECKKY